MPAFLVPAPIFLLNSQPQACWGFFLGHGQVSSGRNVPADGGVTTASETRACVSLSPAFSHRLSTVRWTDHLRFVGFGAHRSPHRQWLKRFIREG